MSTLTDLNAIRAITTDPERAGVAIAELAYGQIDILLIAFAEALEWANAHSEAAQVRQMLTMEADHA